ncbi:MAG: hypothetical protein ACP5D2_03875 [Candidatus Nanoarchaeia archaeon]
MNNLFYYMLGFMGGCVFCLVFIMALNALIQVKKQIKKTKSQ